jgi:hypothetical protein
MLQADGASGAAPQRIFVPHLDAVMRLDWALSRQFFLAFEGAPKKVIAPREPKAPRGEAKAALPSGEAARPGDKGAKPTPDAAADAAAAAGAGPAAMPAGSVPFTAGPERTDGSLKNQSKELSSPPLTDFVNDCIDSSE